MQITQPVSRFASANSDNAYLTQLIMSGPFTLDDLVVDERNPCATLFLIRSIVGENGSATPSTNVFVEAGGNQLFQYTPDQFFHVADVLVDEVSVGAVSSYQFTNVTGDHEIEAVFAADFTANGVPHWWLNAQNPAWAADFEAASLADHDRDSRFAWEKYLAGSDPRDASSFLEVELSKETATVFNLRFVASPDRLYSLQRQAGLDGAWIDVVSRVPGQPDGEGQMTFQRAVDPDPRVFYRVKVETP